MTLKGLSSQIGGIIIIMNKKKDYGMKKIYLAGSFAYASKKITRQRQEKINEVAKYLRSNNYEVYVPHELKIPNAWDYSNEDWSTMVFSNDVVALKECDFIVLLSYGKHKNNAGVAWECGFAFGLGKRVIMVCMDLKETESLMMVNGSYVRLNGTEGLKKYDLEIQPLQENPKQLKQS